MEGLITLAVPTLYLEQQACLCSMYPSASECIIGQPDSSWIHRGNELECLAADCGGEGFLASGALHVHIAMK